MRVRGFGLAILVVLGFSGCNTIKDQQRALAKELTPTLEAAPEPYARKLPKLRIRAYVDEYYRAEQVDYGARIRRQVEEASELTAALGVALEVESIEEWPHSSGGAKLTELVAALEGRDVGENVDFVVGFTSTLPAFTNDLHDLGMARPWSKHFVLRGMNSMVEYDNLGVMLDALSTDERERVYRRRLAHKEVAVFLHEWGHALGALHERDVESIMNPIYSADARSFSAGGVELIRIGLEHRTHRDRWLAASLGYLESVGPGPWIKVELEEAKSLMKAGQVMAATQAMDEATVDRVRRAWNKLSEEDFAGARELIAPIPESLADPPILGIRCRIGTKLDTKAEATLRSCEGFAEADSRNWVAAYGMVELLDRLGERGRAVKYLREAQRRIEATPGADPEPWLAVASAYTHFAALSLAESAASRHALDPRFDEVLKKVAELRKSWRVPKDLEAVGLTAETESEYLTILGVGMGAIERKDFEGVQQVIAELQEKFPGAPGFHVLSCRAAYERKQLDSAFSLCTKAARAHPEAFDPPYFLGMIEVARGFPAMAAGPLERALALDPSHEHTRSVLEWVYRQTRQKAKLAKLRRAGQE
ncbi:MAG: matrixin family metalloprotease [Deltaproteobacteria bacterium]|nr:matrixin family metalloprotease [Deltaproteobacteria bacterium]